MTTTTTRNQLEITRTLAARRDRVWRAWTEPRQLTKWFSPPGFTTPEADVDLREGGAYRVVMQPPEGDAVTVRGVFREIRAPERLAYTWRWDGPSEEESLVTIVLHDEGDRTRLHLVHARLTGPEDVARHTDGWNGCLASLETHLE